VRIRVIQRKSLGLELGTRVWVYSKVRVSNRCGGRCVGEQVSVIQVKVRE